MKTNNYKIQFFCLFFILFLQNSISAQTTETWITTTPKIYIYCPLFAANKDYAPETNSSRPLIKYEIKNEAGTELFKFENYDENSLPADANTYATDGSFTSASPVKGTNHFYKAFLAFPPGKYQFTFKNKSISNKFPEAWIVQDEKDESYYYENNPCALTNVNSNGLSTATNDAIKFYKELSIGDEITTPLIDLPANGVASWMADGVMKRFNTNAN